MSEVLYEGKDGIKQISEEDETVEAILWKEDDHCVVVKRETTDRMIPFERVVQFDRSHNAGI